MIAEDAYLAGLFDGEGTVGVYPNGRKTSHTLSSQIRQNSSETVDKFLLECKTRFGGNLIPQITLSGKTCYNWLLNGAKALHFLETIGPYLRFKKAQAELAVQWYKTRPKASRDSRGRAQKLPEGTFEAGDKVDKMLRLMKQGVCIV